MESPLTTRRRQMESPELKGWKTKVLSRWFCRAACRVHIWLLLWPESGSGDFAQQPTDSQFVGSIWPEAWEGYLAKQPCRLSNLERSLARILNRWLCRAACRLSGLVQTITRVWSAWLCQGWDLTFGKGFNHSLGYLTFPSSLKVWW